MKTTHSVETLEARIAPAGVITFTPDQRTATWTDVDGDQVTLKVSKGRLAETLFTTDQSPATGLLVTKLDLTNAKFAGADISLTATRGPLDGGDNIVNIGYIDSTGHGLGTVVIAGDLGRIDAGDPNITPDTPNALGALRVLSMGALGGTSLPAGVTQTSEIVGKVGSVKVRGSVQGILFSVTGAFSGNAAAAGAIDVLKIGGSLIGDDGADSGRFVTSGRIGTIKIGGNIAGGAGQHSGSIDAGGAIGSLSLGGSLLGGRSDIPSTDGTGVVHSDKAIGSVLIRGSIHGGTQQDSGLLSAARSVGVVKVRGGIVGGSAGIASGGILIGGNAGSIAVKGDVLGGDALDSGFIRVAGTANSVTLVGALTGGGGDGSGSVQLGTDAKDTAGTISIARDVTGGSGSNSGNVSVAGKLGSLRIAGSLHGGSGDESGVASFAADATSVSIAGDIAGGAGANSGRVNSSAPIGSLAIGGNVLGGVANGSGSILSSARIDALSIAGSVIGGDLGDSAVADLVDSGTIQARGIGALNVSGAIIVGADFSAAQKLVNNAAVRVQDDIGTLTIRGGVYGTEETAAIITARGEETVHQNQTTDVAFGKITIGSSVRHALILAGYNATADVAAAEANPNAQIGEVEINGDWVASNLVAGAKWNDNFGNGTDEKGAGVDNPDIVASIAKIRVGGQITGTAENPTDHFGFVAQQIGALKLGPAVDLPPVVINGTNYHPNLISLNAGASNDNDPVSLRYNLAATLDVRLFEFA